MLQRCTAAFVGRREDERRRRSRRIAHELSIFASFVYLETLSTNSGSSRAKAQAEGRGRSGQWCRCSIQQYLTFAKAIIATFSDEGGCIASCLRTHECRGCTHRSGRGKGSKRFLICTRIFVFFAAVVVLFVVR